MLFEKKSCIIFILMKIVEKYHKMRFLSGSNIYFIQLTLYAMTSKVMKTEKGICHNFFLTFYQSHNYV